MRSVLFILIFGIALTAQADCSLVQQMQGQKHFLCRAPGTTRSLHLLDLRGGFSETAYFHGYFLRKEIETGILKGVQVRTERAFAGLDTKNREKLMLIKRCVIDSYRASVSEDFKAGLKNLHQGMLAAGSSVPWSVFEESNYMVEFSIFADSMQRQIAENPTRGSLKVFASCAPYFAGNTLSKPFKKLAEGLRSLKMGCTGISASANISMDGALIHGRNFDTGLLSYYEQEQVIVINRQINGTTSVGLASAGLHYAGGISGINSHGLSVSLHELQTEGVQLRYPSGESDIAPYLLHSVLLKARTLSEAIGIIQTRKGFGAWTFFISDAKTDEAASIELSGNTVVVARHSQKTFLGQSNHFLGGKTSQEGYEYSLNKTLETRARLPHVQRSLQEDLGHINVQWVINRLSGHTDELVGDRSFGRTTTKLYTAATHVMIPGRMQWWMSVAEVYPTNRSHFVGFELSDSEAPQPVRFLGTTKAWEDTSKGAWNDSMKFYIQAYLSNENDHSSIPGLDRTLGLLEQASLTASESQVYEFPYEFMWARIKVLRAAKNIMSRQRETAFEDLTEALEKLIEIENRLGPALHPYELFQLNLWKFRAETLKPQSLQSNSTRAAYRHRAQEILQGLLQKYPRQSELYDLQWGLGQAAQLYIVLDAEIRLGTVE